MNENLPLAGVLPPSLGRGLVKLGSVNTVFTIATTLFCASHWLITHRFSVYMVPGAVAVGGATATLAWWFSAGPMSKRD